MSIRQLTQKLWKSSVLRGPCATIARFASRWTGVQLVSLDICTNADYAKSEFRGSENLEKRIQVVSSVLKKINNHRGAFRGDDVLKVCMMPEFLFRDQTGAYQLETILGRRNADQTFQNADIYTKGILDSAAMSLQYRLANLIKGSEWKNWFFVFGTVLGEKPMTEEMIQVATVKKYTGAGKAIIEAMLKLNNAIPWGKAEQLPNDIAALYEKLSNTNGDSVDALALKIFINVQIATLLQPDAVTACNGAEKALNDMKQLKLLADKLIAFKVPAEKLEEEANKVVERTNTLIASEMVPQAKDIPENVLMAAKDVKTAAETLNIVAKEKAVDKVKVATEHLIVVAKKFVAEKVSYSDKKLQEAGKYIGDAYNILWGPVYLKELREIGDVNSSLKSSLSAFMKPAVRNAAQIFNVALLQEGGLGFPAEPAPFSPPGSFAIAKAAISEIDFLRYNNYGLISSTATASLEESRTILTVENVQALPPGVIPTVDAPNANVTQMERGGTPGTMRAEIEVVGSTTFDKLYIDNDGVIRVGHNLPHEDKLVVGVEVCLDHSSSKDDAGNTVFFYDENGKQVKDKDGKSIAVKGMLQQVKNRYRVRKDHDIHKVQLQLITSCGMSINPVSLLTRDDGNNTLVFLCDGLSKQLEETESKEPLVHVTRSQAIVWHESLTKNYRSSDDIKNNRSLINLNENTNLRIVVDKFKDWKSKETGGNGVFYPAGNSSNSSWFPFVRVYDPVKIPLLAKKA